MNFCNQLSKHIRDMYFGGNWTGVCLRQVLIETPFELSGKKIGSFNSIQVLAYHIYYYVDAVATVMEGNPLTAHDKYSFDCPAINSQTEWDTFVIMVEKRILALVELIEKMPEDKLWGDFTDKKYGNYFRNFLGLIEHTYYHLGQISLIRKLLLVEKF